MIMPQLGSLQVGAGPVGLVAALTLLQNGIPVRIIEKDPNPRMGQRGPGIWVSHFINSSDCGKTLTLHHLATVPRTLSFLERSRCQ